MEKGGVIWSKILIHLSNVLKVAGIFVPLYMASRPTPMLPVGETAGQYANLDIGLMVGGVLYGVGSLLAWNSFWGNMKLSVALCWALVILGGWEACIGGLQLLGYLPSGHSLFAMTGSFYNPGPYSCLLALCIPACIFLRELVDLEGDYGFRLRRFRKRAATVFLILFVCVLPAGLSRSAWIATVVGSVWTYLKCTGLYYPYLYPEYEDDVNNIPSTKKKVTLLVSTLLVVVVAGWLMYVMKPDSAKGRLFMWKISAQIMKENPMGTLDDNFSAHYGEAQEAYFAAGDYEPWEEQVAGTPEYAFNEYLNWGVKYGVVGLYLLVVLCITPWFVGLLGDFENFGARGILLVLYVFAFASYPLKIPVLVAIGAFLMLSCCIYIFIHQKWITNCLVAILMIAVGYFMLPQHEEERDACIQWASARTLYNVGAYQAAAKEYKRLEDKLDDRGAFLFEYGHCLYKMEQYPEAVYMLKRASDYNGDPMILNMIGKSYQAMYDYVAAEKFYIRSTHRLPGRIYPYYLLAKLYAEPDYLSPEDFEKMKRIVMEKEPKVMSTAIREMREELEKIKLE